MSSSSEAKSSLGRKIFDQIWAIFGPLKKRIALVLVLIALGQAMMLVGPFIQGRIIDNITQNKPIEKTYLLIILAGLILIIKDWLTGFIRERYEVRKVDFDIEAMASDQTLDKMLGLSISQHNAEHSGIKQSVINRGQHSLTALVAMFIYEICPTLSRSLIMTAAMCWLSPPLGIVIAITLIIYVAITFLINYSFKNEMKKLERMWNQESKLRNEILYNISHVLVNAQEVKTRAEADLKYIETAARAKKLWLRFLVYAYLKGTVTIILARTIIMAMGTYYVYNGQYSLGSLVIFWSWSYNALDSVANVGSLQRQIIRMWTSIKRYCEFLGTESNIRVPPNPVVLNPVKGRIELKEVSYAYSSRMLAVQDDDYEDDDGAENLKNEPKKNALDKVSFIIEAGETVAIVGESGSGKTTLTGLLLRADDPIEGQVLIDGQDLRVVDLHSYRSQVGVVEQHVPLFDRSIRYNILFGLDKEKAEKVTEEELSKVAQTSQISRFAHKLEKRFDTLIGERGIKLSGGERQRVGIARALIKNPAILIFDEATSNLDAAVEADIREAIREASQGRTTIIIAHRFSTIRYANRIIVMEEGRIVGQGTHAELYKTCESYKRLVDHQISQPEISPKSDEIIFLPEPPDNRREILSRA